MNLAERFTGVFTALVTPFVEGKVDFAAFEALVKEQLAAGVAGLVPVGTTGEAVTLEKEEIAEIIRRTVALADGRAFVLAGTGSNSTRKTVEMTELAETCGADGCLVVTPYYNKPSQAGLVDHYAAVAAATHLPIVLYSVPGRCGVEIAPDTAAKLARRFFNVIGIKEAGGRCERVSELRLACGHDFIIHSGDDAMTLPFLALGASGVTSVVANYAPVEMVALLDAWRRGRQDRGSAPARPPVRPGQGDVPGRQPGTDQDRPGDQGAHGRNLPRTPGANDRQAAQGTGGIAGKVLPTAGNGR